MINILKLKVNCQKLLFQWEKLDHKFLMSKVKGALQCVVDFIDANGRIVKSAIKVRSFLQVFYSKVRVEVNRLFELSKYLDFFI